MPNAENEVKLRVPARFDLRALSQGSNGFSVTPVEARRLSSIYYDSDDLRLLHAGCSLRYRRGDGWTLKLPDDSRNAGLLRHEYAFPDEGPKVPAAALDLATAYLRGKPVQPVTRLRTVRKATRVNSRDGEELAEIVDDDVRVIEDGHVAKRFREVEVELRAGASSDVLDELVSWLQDKGAGKIDNTPKIVRSLRGPEASPSPQGLPQEPPTTAGALVKQALRSALQRLQRNDPIVRSAATAASVHQMRVATRRMRSDLRTFLPLLQHEWACALRDRLHWLADELGTVRDSDVMLQSINKYAARLPQADAEGRAQVVQRFSEVGMAARSSLLAALRSPRYVELLDELVDAAENPRVLPKADAPPESVVPELMHDPWKAVCDAIECVEDDPSFEQLHQARIKAKRCRYACEAVEPACGKASQKLAKKIEKLQKVLGEYHDAVVLQQRLRAFQGDGQALFVAGALSAMAAADAERDRSSWPAVWKKASKKKLRFWV